jgi:serine/threonine-protein kinase SRPK3|eukprot:COSAG02_NODE_2567_length_8517_cov_2.589570_5_plen_641_part_00
MPRGGKAAGRGRGRGGGGGGGGRGGGGGGSGKHGSDSDGEASIVASDSGSEEDAQDYRPGGYHVTRVGDVFNNERYTVLRKLGWGHFSTVWLVYDKTSERVAALKIQKSAKRYTEAAQDEVDMLVLLSEQRAHAAETGDCVVTLFDHFFHHGPNGKHMCMVFEVMGQSLLSLIKHYDYRGIPMPAVRLIAKQMALGLDYMHRVCGLIHTDLKPENVLICLSPEEQATMHSLGKEAFGELQRRQAVELAARPKSKKALKRQRQKQKQRAQQQEQGEEALSEAGAGGEEDVLRPASAEADDSDTAGHSEGGAGSTAAPGEADSRQVCLPSSASVPGGRDAALGRPASDVFDRLAILGKPNYTKWKAEDYRVKLADFGTACWVNKQFTDDIQTREYRCPEVILGAKYSTPADMWSLACVVFELACGDQLFDPRTGGNYGKDEDHLALCIELLGRMPKKLQQRGKYAADYFNRKGELRNIPAKKLKFWPLAEMLAQKYSDVFQEEAQAIEFAEFLLPMLNFQPENRATAEGVLTAAWLNGGTATTGSVTATGTAARTASSPAAAADGATPAATDLDAAAGCEPEPQSLGGAAPSPSAQGLGPVGEAALRATGIVAEPEPEPEPEREPEPEPEPSVVATVSDDDL